jgi:hypothetical protein
MMPTSSPNTKGRRRRPKRPKNDRNKTEEKGKTKEKKPNE